MTQHLLARLASLVLGFSVALGAACTNAAAADGHWVTTWGCGPQLTEPGNLPPVPLADSTLRQFVRTTIGGSLIRVRFSNAYGKDPVTINAAHVALAAGAGSSGNGDVAAGSGKALSFRGAPGTVIPPGEAVLSDPVAFELPAITNLAISTFLGKISATTINGHPGSRTTSFILPGNHVSDNAMSSASKTAHWYLITGVEVMGESNSRAIVVLGDSITDGRGSTTDQNDRWPDALAKRLAANAETRDVSVVNMGIGGNAIFGGLGPAAVNRFDRDVLQQSGVRYFVLFEGVNDIGSGGSSMSTATNLVNAYIQFATKAKAKNIKAYAATITPFGGSGYYSDLHEAERQFVNAWIRTNQVYDAVIDFDAKVRDPANPVNLLPAYSSDNLHLNPAGYEAMANAIDLNLFKP